MPGVPESSLGLPARILPGLVCSTGYTVAYLWGRLERWTYLCCWSYRLATDYLMTSWDPDLFRWLRSEEAMGDIYCWV